jgi:transposase
LPTRKASRSRDFCVRYLAPREKRETILQESEKQDPSPKDLTPAGGSEGASTKKGHGRHVASDYTGAETTEVKHAEFKPGDDCPECDRGTLYEQTPGLVVRVKAASPFTATIHELEKLRCGLCGVIFTAEPPVGGGSKKYDDSVGSLIALLKYGAGMPFCRLEKIQDGFGCRYRARLRGRSSTRPRR